ncbi:Dabb family protein [Hydrogenophaga sp. PAMC20947]|uniref:Dabb family protein n=1 Tax=Hydrogenophaga sp. PAMC20947 TaxID=2565558 RepID=UPI00109DAE09|nr:Dabb family protein [Hydrogenophaga sp. PAMC20947]QCB46477.1 Dabb family protein [Hydrogenophaga sp. PAMC20947]
MLHHTVMWKLHDEDKAGNVAQAVRLLQGCAAIVPGIVRFEVAAAQPGLECTYDVVLNSTFDDGAALAAYQAHPDHVAIKPFMKSVVASRQCMDYET